MLTHPAPRSQTEEFPRVLLEGFRSFNGSILCDGLFIRQVLLILGVGRSHSAHAKDSPSLAVPAYLVKHSEMEQEQNKTSLKFNMHNGGSISQETDCISVLFWMHRLCASSECRVHCRPQLLC